MYSETFEQEAVRIAPARRLPRERVAADLGIGKSTLGKWHSQYCLTDLVAAPQANLARVEVLTCIAGHLVDRPRRPAAMELAKLHRRAITGGITASRTIDSFSEIATLRIELKNSDPLIWRVVEVPA